MKRLCRLTVFICLTLVLLFSCKSTIFAASNCTRESAMQMSKILYKEVGGTLTSDTTEDAFAKFVTAAVILNNASRKSGSTMYEKEMNLTNGNYSGYSSYRDKSFEDVVYSKYQSKLLYISECVLNGTFTLPSNMTLQASPSIVQRYGTVWTHVTVSKGAGSDVYFGYEGSSLKSTDIYGKTITNNSPEYYRQLAGQLINQDYSKVTSQTVCNGVVDTSNVNVSPISGGSSSSSGNGSSSGGQGGTNAPSAKYKTSTYKAKTFHTPTDFCSDENVQKALGIIKAIINILKVLAPIFIIITGGISFFKVVMGDGEVKDAVKTLITKVVVAAFIFFLPSLFVLAADSVAKMTHSDVDVKKCLNITD